MQRPSFDEATVEHQYDTLVKMVLTGEAKNIRAETAKRRAREVNFSDLSDSLIENLGTCDDCLCDYFTFEVNGFDIIIRNELLAEAIENLPERKRNIILMSYFLDMKDCEIAELLNLVRSTVTYHRERQGKLRYRQGLISTWARVYRNWTLSASCVPSLWCSFHSYQ